MSSSGEEKGQAVVNKAGLTPTKDGLSPLESQIRPDSLRNAAPGRGLFSGLIGANAAADKKSDRVTPSVPPQRNDTRTSNQARNLVSDEIEESDIDGDEESGPLQPSKVAREFRELTLKQILVRKHIHTASLSVLAITAVGFLLVHLRPVLLPFIQALMLTYTLTPLIDLLTAKASRSRGGFRLTPPEGVEYTTSKSNGSILYVRRPRDTAKWILFKEAVVYNLRVLSTVRLPRGLAIIVALIIAALITTGVGAIIASSITDLSQNAGKYTERIQQMIEFVMLWTRSVNMDISKATVQQQLMANNGFVSPVSQFFLHSVSIVFDELSNGFLMLLFTVYLLLGYQPHKKTTGIRAEVDRQVKRYIGCKVLLSASTGTLVGIALSVLNVDLALVFGLLSFLLNFIPNVGSVIAINLPMPVVLFDPSKTWLDALLTFVVPGTVQILVRIQNQQTDSVALEPTARWRVFSMWGVLELLVALRMIMGNVIEPRVFGKAMELHPVTVLLALMLWGSLWGVVGMILSVPMTAVLKICLDSLDHPMTKFCARLMEGKSAPEERVKKPKRAPSIDKLVNRDTEPSELEALISC